MCNAKSELISVLSSVFKVDDVTHMDVVAAYIEYETKKIILKVNHTEEDWIQFMDELDFNYNNDFGRQYIFGDVWLNNQQWLERGEYDGSEWWEHKVCPKVPFSCF